MLDLSRLAQTGDWALWVPGRASQPRVRGLPPSLSASISEASDTIPDLADTSVKAPVDDDTLLLTTYLVCAKQAFSQINLYSKF